jgi:ankyrin repeat protein
MQFFVFQLALLTLTTMVIPPPEQFSMITINGEEYMPTPHEFNPELPKDMVWMGFERNSLFLSDPEWYDPLGQDLITQRRIWGVPSESGQLEQFRKLLHDHPKRALDMMFAAAVKGKAHVMRFLLEQGVRGTANKADGDDMSLVPLHAAAFQGHLECVKILMEEGKVDPNTKDELGGSPLMRACAGDHPDIAEYLLAAGADMRMIQTAHLSAKYRIIPDNEPATDALVFAAGSEALQCVKLLVKHAEEIGLNTTNLVTPLVLAVAAHTNSLEILDFLLETGGYYQAKHDNQSENNISILTEPMKDAIEYSLLQCLSRSRYKSLKVLFTFFESRTEQGDYQWTSLKDKTLDTLDEALWQLASHNDDEHKEVFTFISDTVLAPNSHLTNPATQEKKETALHDALVRAAQHGHLEMMKLIESKHTNLNVNKLAHYNGAEYTTPLFMAAGLGHIHIIEHLFSTHGDQLNIHLGAGEFANGPTALWSAVSNGHVETVKLLLQKDGGPLESMEPLARPTDVGEEIRIIVAATKDFRSSVRLLSETTWINEHGAVNEASLKGTVTEKSGMQTKYVVLDLKAGELAAWDSLQLRTSDGELLSIETKGRPLKVNEPGIQPLASWWSVAGLWNALRFW